MATIEPTRSTLEPPLGTGTLSAAVAIGGIVLAVVSLIVVLFPPAWLSGSARFAPLALAGFGLLIAIRFTRNDRNVAGRIARLEIACVDYEMELQKAEVLLSSKDDLISDHVETIDFLRDLLAKPPDTFKITTRDGTRIVPKHERNETWKHALALAKFADSDFGKLPGHVKVGHTQDEQTAALKLLRHVGVASHKNTIWRLTVTRVAAIDLLNAFAVEVNQTPPPPTPSPDHNPDASGSRPEVASGLSSGWVSGGGSVGGVSASD